MDDKKLRALYENLAIADRYDMSYDEFKQQLESNYDAFSDFYRVVSSIYKGTPETPDAFAAAVGIKMPQPATADSFVGPVMPENVQQQPVAKPQPAATQQDLITTAAQPQPTKIDDDKERVANALYDRLASGEITPKEADEAYTKLLNQGLIELPKNQQEQYNPNVEAPQDVTRVDEQYTGAKPMSKSEKLFVEVWKYKTEQIKRAAEKLMAEVDSKLKTTPSPLTNRTAQERHTNLWDAKNFLNNVIHTLDSDQSNKVAFLRGIGDQGQNLIPFAGALFEMSTINHINSIRNKSPEERTESEQLALKAYNLLATAESSGLSSSPYEMGRTFGMMLPYAAEFAATSGVYGEASLAARGALATKLAKTGLPKMVQKGINFGVRNLAGTIAQATANPQRYALETARRMSDVDIALINSDDDIVGFRTIKKGEDAGTAFAKAYLTNLSEFLTERFGMIPGKAGRVLRNNISPEKLAKYTLGLYAKKTGKKTLSEVEKALQKVGWHGVITEVWGEEYPNAIINNWITGDQDWAEVLNPLSEDMLNMVIPSMLFSGMFFVPKWAAQGYKAVRQGVENLFKVPDGDLGKETKQAPEPADITPPEIMPKEEASPEPPNYDEAFEHKVAGSDMADEVADEIDRQTKELDQTGEVEKVTKNVELEVDNSIDELNQTIEQELANLVAGNAKEKATSTKATTKKKKKTASTTKKVAKPVVEMVGEEETTKETSEQAEKKKKQPTPSKTVSTTEDKKTKQKNPMHGAALTVKDKKGNKVKYKYDRDKGWRRVIISRSTNKTTFRTAPEDKQELLSKLYWGGKSKAKKITPAAPTTNVEVKPPVKSGEASVTPTTETVKEIEAPEPETKAPQQGEKATAEDVVRGVWEGLFPKFRKPLRDKKKVPSFDALKKDRSKLKDIILNPDKYFSKANKKEAVEKVKDVLRVLSSNDILNKLSSKKNEKAKKPTKEAQKASGDVVKEEKTTKPGAEENEQTTTLSQTEIEKIQKKALERLAKEEKESAKKTEEQRKKSKKGRPPKKIYKGLYDKEVSKSSNKNIRNKIKDVTNKIAVGAVRITDDIAKELRRLLRDNKKLVNDGEASALNESDEKYIKALLSNEKAREFYNRYGKLPNKLERGIRGVTPKTRGYAIKKAQTKEELTKVGNEALNEMDKLNTATDSYLEFKKRATIINNVLKEAENKKIALPKSFVERAQRGIKKALYVKVRRLSDSNLVKLAENTQSEYTKKLVDEEIKRRQREALEKEKTKGTFGVGAWDAAMHTSKAKETYNKLKQEYIDKVSKLMLHLEALKARIKNPKSKLTTERKAQALKTIQQLEKRIDQLTDAFNGFVEKPNLRKGLLIGGGFPLTKAELKVSKETVSKLRKQIENQAKLAVKSMDALKLSRVGKIVDLTITDAEKRRLLKEQERADEERRKIHKIETLTNVDATEQEISEVLSEHEASNVADAGRMAVKKASDIQGERGLYSEVYGYRNGKGSQVYMVIRNSKGDVVAAGPVSIKGGSIKGIGFAEKGKTISSKNIEQKKKAPKTTKKQNVDGVLDKKLLEIFNKKSNVSYRWNVASEQKLSESPLVGKLIKKLHTTLKKFGLELVAVKARDLHKVIDGKMKRLRGGGVAFIRNGIFHIVVDDIGAHEYSGLSNFLALHEAVHIIRLIGSVLRHTTTENTLFNDEFKKNVLNIHRRATKAIANAAENIKNGIIESPLEKALFDYIAFRVIKETDYTAGKVYFKTLNMDASVNGMNEYTSVVTETDSIAPDARKFIEKRVIEILNSEEFDAFMDAASELGWNDSLETPPILGLSNMDEFMAEGLSNPFFARMLDAIPTDTKLSGETKSSLLREFVNAFIEFYNKYIRPRISNFNLLKDKQTVYNELKSVIDDYAYQIEKNNELSLDMQAMQDLYDVYFNKEGVDEDGAPSSRKERAIVVDSIAKYIVKNYGLVNNRAAFDVIMADINKGLKHGLKADEAMQNTIWRKLSKLDGFRNLKTLRNKLKNNIKQGKGKGGVKVAKGITGDYVNVLRKMLAAITTTKDYRHSVKKSYEKYKAVMDKLNSGYTLSPDEALDFMYYRLGAFPLLSNKEQTSIIKEVNQFIKNGRTDFMEFMRSRGLKKYRLHNAVLRDMFGDGFFDGKNVKVASPHVEYKAGDIVIRGDRLRDVAYIYEILEDGVTLSDINTKSAKVKLRTDLMDKVVKLGKRGEFLGLAKLMEKLPLKVLGFNHLFEMITANRSRKGKKALSLNKSTTAGRLAWRYHEAEKQRYALAVQYHAAIERGKLLILGELKRPKKADKPNQVGVLKATALAMSRVAKFSDNIGKRIYNDLSKKYPTIFNSANKDKLTFAHLLYRWQTTFAPDNQKAYEREGIDAVELRKDIEKHLQPWMIKWGKFLMGVYSKMYDRIDDVFYKMNGVHLEQKLGYVPNAVDSPHSNHLDFIAPDMLVLPDNVASEVRSSILKERRGMIPADADANEMMLSYIKKATHYMSMADIISDYGQILNSHALRIMLRKGYNRGEFLIKTMDELFQSMVLDRDLGEPTFANKTLSALRKNVVVSTLLFNLSIFPKQLVSFPAVLAEMGWDGKRLLRFSKNLIKTLVNPPNTYRIWSDSNWLRKRAAEGFERDITAKEFDNILGAVQAAFTGLRGFATGNLKQGYRSFVSLKNKLVSLGMLPNKAGDIGGVIIGSTALYNTLMEEYIEKLSKQYGGKKNIPERTLRRIHKLVMDYVEQVADSSQQTKSRAYRNLFQVSRGASGLISIYNSSPFLYLSKVLTSYEVAKRTMFAKGPFHPDSIKAQIDLAKKIFIYHMILPTLFTLASAGFYCPKDDTGDCDWGTLFKLSMVGSFTGMPLVGFFIKWLSDTFLLEHEYRTSINPVLDDIEQLAGQPSRLSKRIQRYKGTSNYELTLEDETIRDIMAETAAITIGYPYKPIQRMKTNTRKLGSYYFNLNADPHKIGLLYFSYGEYMVPQLKMHDINGNPINERRYRNE